MKLNKKLLFLLLVVFGTANIISVTAEEIVVESNEEKSKEDMNLNEQVSMEEQEIIIEAGDGESEKLITNVIQKNEVSGRSANTLNGWQIKNGETYYYINGVMQRGISQIGDKKYYFGEVSGILRRNLFVETVANGNKYYTNEAGIIQTGWKNIGGQDYYFDSEGIMQRGIVDIYKNGNRYYFGTTSGILYRGWIHEPNGNIYYTNGDGVIQTGEQPIDGELYKFSDNGLLQTGWQTIAGNKYYFFANGKKATMIQKIAGIRYLFSDSGILLRSNIQVWIDVSRWQYDIDWTTVWNSGEIDGVILRIGYGSAPNQYDAKFKDNLKEIIRLNIPYTIYLYSYAANATEAVWEANNLLYWMKENEIRITCGLPVYYDIEEYGAGIAPEVWEQIVTSFVTTMANNGIGASIYAYKYFVDNYFNPTTRGYVTWIAHYTGDKVNGEKTVNGRPDLITSYNSSYWNMWQYTSTGIVPGIGVYVDKNILF